MSRGNSIFKLNDDTDNYQQMQSYFTSKNNAVYMHNFSNSQMKLCGEVPDMSKPKFIYNQAGNVYVIGGRDTNDKVTGKCYELKDKNLSPLPAMIEPRISFGCFVSNDYVYCAGGMNENNKDTNFVDRLQLGENPEW